MQITLTEEGYTLDGKWKLVPIIADKSSIKAMANSKSMDDQLEYPKLCDLIDLFADDRINAVLNFAYYAAIKDSPRPVFETQRQSRVGDIEIGGEITKEFEQAGRELWCKLCGCNMSAGHLPRCPTLKSKL